MISCIVLAAGESRRFGSPKPLARIGAQTVITRLLKTLLETKIGEIIVVLGADAETIKPEISRDKRIKIVLNKDFFLGQGSSFKAGLAALNRSCQGVFLLPVDTPFVRKETFDMLIKTSVQNPSLIIVPTYDDHKGHPPIIPRGLFQEYVDLKPGQPLFTVLRRHETEILKIPVQDKGVVQSFNTPEEFKKILNPKL